MTNDFKNDCMDTDKKPEQSSPHRDRRHISIIKRQNYDIYKRVIISTNRAVTENLPKRPHTSLLPLGAQVLKVYQSLPGTRINDDTMMYGGEYSGTKFLAIVNTRNIEEERLMATTTRERTAPWIELIKLLIPEYYNKFLNGIPQIYQYSLIEDKSPTGKTLIHTVATIKYFNCTLDAYLGQSKGQLTDFQCLKIVSDLYNTISTLAFNGIHLQNLRWKDIMINPNTMELCIINWGSVIYKDANGDPSPFPFPLYPDTAIKINILEEFIHEFIDPEYSTSFLGYLRVPEIGILGELCEFIKTGGTKNETSEMITKCRSGLLSLIR